MKKIILSTCLLFAGLAFADGDVNKKSKDYFLDKEKCSEYCEIHKDEKKLSFEEKKEKILKKIKKHENCIEGATSFEGIQECRKEMFEKFHKGKDKHKHMSEKHNQIKGEKVDKAEKDEKK